MSEGYTLVMSFFCRSSSYSFYNAKSGKYSTSIYGNHKQSLSSMVAFFENIENNN
jgi:hypothetical protein